MRGVFIAAIVFSASLSACPQLDKVKKFLDCRIKEHIALGEADSGEVRAFEEVRDYIDSIDQKSFFESILEWRE